MKVGDQINVQVNGGIEGAIFTDSNGDKILIKPGSIKLVSGQIQRDLQKYWRIELAGSIDGVKKVHVEKTKNSGRFAWLLNLF